jgi:hypothetical protein
MVQASTDKLAGVALLLFSILVFAYYTLWVIVTVCPASLYSETKSRPTCQDGDTMLTPQPRPNLCVHPFPPRLVL